MADKAVNDRLHSTTHPPTHLLAMCYACRRSKAARLVLELMRGKRPNLNSIRYGRWLLIDVNRGVRPRLSLSLARTMRGEVGWVGG